MFATLPKFAVGYVKSSTKSYVPILYDPYIFRASSKLQQFSPRDSMLFMQYASILSNSYLIFLNSFNMTARESSTLRREFSKSGLKFQFINSKIFKGAVIGTKYENLESFCSGMTYIVYPGEVSSSTRLSTTDTVDCVKVALKSVRDYPRRLIMSGALIDNLLITPDQLTAIGKMKPKAQMMAELLGILENNSVQLANVLEYPAAHLFQLLSLVHHTK